jgi:hypothetical protein
MRRSFLPYPLLLAVLLCANTRSAGAALLADSISVSGDSI